MTPQEATALAAKAAEAFAGGDPDTALDLIRTTEAEAGREGLASVVRELARMAGARRPPVLAEADAPELPMSWAGCWAGRVTDAAGSDAYFAEVVSSLRPNTETGAECLRALLAAATGVEEVEEEAPPVTFDARWQRVTCRDCKRVYTCCPEEDYYGDSGGGRPDSATSGRCFACMLKAGGMDPDTTPARVIDLAGAGTDPRDLSREAAGGAS